MPLTPPSIVRLRILPDEADDSPRAVVGARPPGSRRPHADASVAHVRRLLETTTLTYSEISAQTGVGRASISRWARDGGWMRPLDAPIATDRVPTVRASQKLKLRKLAERLRRLAERYISEQEASAEVDPDRLLQALQVVKMARLEAMGRRRRRRFVGETRTGLQDLSEQEAIRTALRELRGGGVDLDRIPKEAMDLLTAAKCPAEDNPAFRERGKRR